MPSRAAISLTAILALSSAGCSTWPSPNHTAVTNDSIRGIVEEAVQGQPQPETPPSLVLECSGLDDARNQLSQQAAAFEKLSSEVQALTAANPSFANSDCPAVAGDAADKLDGRVLVGSTEWIYISPPGHHYKARVDSGAATSSLSAVNIERFERNGDKWVRFDLKHDDEAEPIRVEAPLSRHVRIRQASSDEADRRPVVMLTVNLGNNLQIDTEFSLTDRSQMTYPILLGRSFLRDVTLIDVGRQYVQPKFEPDQPKPEKKTLQPVKEKQKQEKSAKDAKNAGTDKDDSSSQVLKAEPKDSQAAEPQE